MTQLPIPSLTQKQRLELYTLLGQQVQSYHRHYHMGDSTSVPTETARELLDSVWYTLDAAGGLAPSQSLSERLSEGQAVLAGRLEQARKLYRLVEATVPEYRSQCHWETVQALGAYLRRYDRLHFAHRAPEELVYPLLAEIPENRQGLDLACFYLECLWLENQILHAFPAEALAGLEAVLPPDYWEAPQNLCEQPLANALGRVLLGLGMDSLTLTENDRQRLSARLRTGEIRPLLESAMDHLCLALALASPAAGYSRGVIPQMLPRLQIILPGGDLSHIFL